MVGCSYTYFDLLTTTSNNNRFQNKTKTNIFIRYETDISGGDNFQIINLEEAAPLCVARIFSCADFNRVNDRQGLIITNPDIMITPSRISESLGCIRKGILSDRIRSYGSGRSLPATLGQVKHAFIEVSMK